MAQGRMLKKNISSSEKLGKVKTDRARVLWFMILPHLDAAGRLEANTRRIKGQITTMLPYSEKAIQSSLEQLHEVGLLVLYVDSGIQYLEYTRFGDFQTLNPDREAKTEIPAPTPENSRVLPITPLKLSKDKSNVSEVKYSSNSDESRLASFLFALILKRKPDHKVPNLQEWAKIIDQMIRLDKRSPERIEAVIQWCQNDSFWQDNILSTIKLRKQFDQLEMKMGKTNAPGTQNNQAHGGKSRRDLAAERTSEFGESVTL